MQYRGAGERCMSTGNPAALGNCSRRPLKSGSGFVKMLAEIKGDLMTGMYSREHHGTRQP